MSLSQNKVLMVMIFNTYHRMTALYDLYVFNVLPKYLHSSRYYSSNKHATI